MKLFNRERRRDALEKELAELSYRAGRLMVKHPEYAQVHVQINEKLTEWEAEDG